MSKADARIDLRKCFVDWTDSDFGQRVYICRSRDYDSPLGFVWGKPYYIQHGPSRTPKSSKYTFFDVKTSYVTDWARRNGIRSLINQKILEHFLAVTSAGMTKDGMRFMKSSGYVRDELLGWVLRRNKISKCKMAAR